MTGPPLVLVHGAGSARWGFTLLRPLLEESFSVIAIDRRGRGDSSDGDGPYAIESEFEDVAAVVRDAGEGALLFGHSYGALVAAGAASLIESLPRLVLYEPPMGGVLAGQERIDRWESLIETGDRELAVREFLETIGGYSPRRDRGDEGHAGLGAAHAGRPHLATRVARRECAATASSSASGCSASRC